MKIKHLLFALSAVAFMGVGCTPEEQDNEPKAQLATLTTIEASSVLSSSIVTGGNITADGGAEVTERGVCYSEAPGAVVEGNKVAATTAGKGAFEVTITGLEFGTTYYYRAYAVNKAGVAYGEEKSATTVQPVLATVTTSDVTNAAGQTANCGGNITNDGNSPILARGVCWGESENPTIDGNKTEDGTGKGEFTSTMTDLVVGRTYYVRAYATNDAGTAYGEQKSFFTIEPQLPEVSTSQVTDLTSTGATAGGNVTNDGGVEVTRGVCWATHKEPTIDDNKAEAGTGAGEFNCEVTGLVEGTVYYLRAYATNSVGTVYGEQRVFAPWYLGTGEEMALISGGTFTVGEGAVHTDAGPNTWQCTLPDFYIAKTEVTQGLWAEIMGADYLDDKISDGQKADGYICYPVGRDNYNPQPCVTWFDAVIFCNKLSIARGEEPVYTVNGETDPDKWDKTGAWEANVICDWTKKGFRLPALPEWEWAAGGGQVPLTEYPGTDDFSELGLYGHIEGYVPGEGLFTVATRLPNRLGLYDMVGNATEWVWELWFEYPGGSRTYYDEVITWNYGQRKAIKRGGTIWNWGQQVYYTTSNWTDPIDDRNWPCGMRLARTK